MMSAQRDTQTERLQRQIERKLAENWDVSELHVLFKRILMLMQAQSTAFNETLNRIHMDFVTLQKRVETLEGKSATADKKEVADAS